MKINYKLVVIGLLLVFLIQVNTSIRQKTINRDAFAQWLIGDYFYFKEGILLGEDDFEPLTIFPVACLHNIPLLFMADFGDNRTDYMNKYVGLGEYRSFYKWGMLSEKNVKILKEQYNRDPTISEELLELPRSYLYWDVFALSLFGALLGFLVFIWAKSAYGLKSGLIALTLYSFSPWMISLSRLVHNDLMVALVTTLAFYMIWKFFKKATLKNAILLGVVMGIMLATKINTLYVVIIFIISLFIFGKVIKINWKQRLKYFIIIMIIAVIVLDSIFLYHDMFQTLENNRFPTYSELFQKLEKNPLINKIPIPLPYKYIAAFDLTKAAANQEFGPHSSWLNGEFAPHGFKSFYFYSLLYKNTIPELLFFIGAIVGLLFFSRKNNFTTNYLLLIFFFIFIFTSLTLKINIGGRHLSPLFPLMFIIGSRVAKFKLKNKKIIPIIIMCLLVWQVGEAIAIFPHHTAYFNQIAGGPENGHTHFKDSNIDFDQDDLLVKWYFEKNPDLDLAPPCYGFTGKVLMNVEFINFQMPNCFYWLKQFEPVDYIGYSWLVYEVDGQWYKDESGKIGFNPGSKMLKGKIK